MKKYYMPFFVFALIVNTSFVVAAAQQETAAETTTAKKSAAKKPTAKKPSVKQGDRPNVLFISVDDLNDWIGCLGGHAGAKTPNLDRLAKRGVLFESAHCSAPICNPSRASLMTGVLPSRSGIYKNSPYFRDSSVLEKAATLPQYFQQHGYHAMRGGKIFHHGAITDQASWNEGFPSLKKHKPASSIPANMEHTLKIYKWKVGGLKITDKQMDDGLITDWGIKQLNRKHTKPFFLAVGLYHPHLPWFTPQKYYDMHPLKSVVLPKIKDDDLNDVPKIALRQERSGFNKHKEIIKKKQWAEKIQAYQASISFADAQVGRLLDALDKSAYRDNTYIVLWSDHGWHLGEKLRWTKFSLWEESTRVVLMIAGPPKSKTSPIKQGGRSPRPVSLLDIYPTLVELCGLPAKKKIDGQSLVPLLKNPNKQWDRPALTTFGQNNHAIRSEKWRYVRWSNGDEELYDRVKDPMEWKNLAKDPQYTELKTKLAKWFPKENVPSAKRKTEKPKREKPKK